VKIITNSFALLKEARVYLPPSVAGRSKAGAWLPICSGIGSPVWPREIPGVNNIKEVRQMQKMQMNFIVAYLFKRYNNIGLGNLKKMY
jgi:hypothetical protein